MKLRTECKFLPCAGHSTGQRKELSTIYLLYRI